MSTSTSSPRRPPPTVQDKNVQERDHSIPIGGDASNEQHVLVDIVLGGSTNLRMSINQVINHEITMRIITEGRNRVVQSPIITDQARYPNQGTYDARLRSYVSCPTTKTQRPKELSEAGFFY